MRPIGKQLSHLTIQWAVDLIHHRSKCQFKQHILPKLSVFQQDMGHSEKGYTTTNYTITNYTTTYTTTNLGQTLKCQHLAFGPVWTRYIQQLACRTGVIFLPMIGLNLY